MAAGVSAGISEGYAELHNDTQSVGLYGKTAERTKDWEDFRKNAKGISWTAFVLSFFVSAVGVWQVRGTGIMTLSFPFVKSFMPAMEG